MIFAKYHAALTALLFASAICGCREDTSPDPLGTYRKDAAVLFPTNSNRPPGTRQPTGQAVTMVHLYAAAIELPLGASTGSEKIWSRLDCKSFDPACLERMNLNGIRVGICRKADWPELANVLNQFEGRMLKSNITAALPGKPMSVIIGRHKTPRTIFLFRQDQTLAGKDYLPGDKLLQIKCSIRNRKRTDLMVSVIPQIQLLKEKMTYVRDANRYSVRSKRTIHSFYSLAWNVPISSKDFIIIGPASAANRSLSAGRHFFFHESKGLKYETLLILMPDVIHATQGITRKAGKLKPLTLPKKVAGSQ